MKVTAYSAAINSLLTTNQTHLGMGSRHPELDIDQAYMIEVELADDLNLNIVNGVAASEGAVILLGGDGVDIEGDEIKLSAIAQIHIRNTGDTVLLASMDYNDQIDVLNQCPVQPGGEIAIFSQQDRPATTTLDLVAANEGESISAKVFVSGKQ